MSDATRSSRIRPVNFFAYGRQIVDLLAESFDDAILVEGASFQRSRNLASSKNLLRFLDMFHPILSRFGEVFVWEDHGQVIGTGAVIRTDVSNAETWELVNFAAAQTHVLKFETWLKLRSLLRVAIRHAVNHGAVHVQAFVQSDNRVVMRLCLAEGFREVEERSYWLLGREHMAQARQAARRYPDVQWIRQKHPVKYSTIRWLLFYLRGARRETYSLYRQDRFLANVDLSTSKDPRSPYRLAITPNGNASSNDVDHVITLCLSTVPEKLTSTPVAVISLPSGSTGEAWSMMERTAPVLAVKRKLLQLDSNR